jgi:hypothetical protein
MRSLARPRAAVSQRGRGVLAKTGQRAGHSDDHYRDQAKYRRDRLIGPLKTLKRRRH